MSKTDSGISYDTNSAGYNDNFFGILRTTNIATNNISFINSNNSVVLNVGINNATNLNQGQQTIAIGSNAGFLNQGNNSVAIGNQSGEFNQKNDCVAIGVSAGDTNMNPESVAIGVSAGYTNQGTGSVAIGYQAGFSNQGAKSVAIGTVAGKFDQGSNSVAIGNLSGCIGQENDAIAIGYTSGFYYQHAKTVTIGQGTSSQGEETVSIGNQTNTFCNSVAIGNYTTSFPESVAIGSYASCGSNSVSIGYSSGLFTSPIGTNNVLIGTDSGIYGSDYNYCVGIGSNVFQNHSNNYCVAIGNDTGDGQHEQTIILNASGLPLTSALPSSLYISPIREDTTSSPPNSALHWDSTSKELVRYVYKTFVINHPLSEEKYLVHGCVEGPESGIFYRGIELIDNSIGNYYIKEVKLPKYVSKIGKNFTVMISPVYDLSNNIEYELDKIINSTQIKDNKFYIKSNKITKVNWLVKGTRIEINSEVDKKNTELLGFGPYKYLNFKKVL